MLAWCRNTIRKLQWCDRGRGGGGGANGGGRKCVCVCVCKKNRGLEWGEGARG